MKRSVLIKLGFLVGLVAGAGAQGQVFNVHDIQNGYFFYGGYNVMAFGQGAAADPGNNIWNGFGNASKPGSTASFGNNHPDDLLRPGNPGNPYAWSSTPWFAEGTALFSPADYSATDAGNATSAGALSPITIPVMKYGINSGNTAALAPSGSYPSEAATARTNVPVMLFSEAAVVNGSSPGVGTATRPQGLMILSNVPAGTYDLYLYGANFDGTRGAAFVVDSGTPTNGLFQTINSYAESGYGPETNFVLGMDYTVYNNVTPKTNGTIQITWGAVSNANSGLTGEGDFNGLQLVPGQAVQAGPTVVAAPTDAVFAQGTTATLFADARGNPEVALQWFAGNPPGTPVAAQNSRILTLTAASVSESGDYFLVATNIYGAVTSSVARLTIAAAPMIMSESTTTSSNAVVLYGGRNHFGLTVTAFGDAGQPWSFYWQSNGVTVAVTTNAQPGGTRTNSFTWANTTGGATYSCIVSNSYGTAATNALAVTIVPAPVNPYTTALLGLMPFAYWPLDETSNTVTYDYISGNNGTAMANAGFAIGQPGPVSGFGTASLAYTFNGSSAVVDVPGANLNLTGPLTLVAWVQPQVASSFKTAIGKGDQSYRISVDANGLAHFNDAGGLDAVGGPYLDSGAWHQVVGAYNGSNVFLYVDGALVNSEQDPVKPGNSLDFYIGGTPDHGGNRSFPGSVAQVAILTNVLTATQVQSLFQAGRTPVFIATEPTNVSGFVGGQASFSVVATGLAPLAYQWTGPAGVIAGATNATLLLTDLTANAPANNGPGTYYCTITNPDDSTNTPNDGSVQLSVNSSAPFFVQDLPSSVFAVVGSTVVLSPVEAGTPPITNQWFYDANSTPTTALQNGGQIGGANSATLVITNVQASNAGFYQVWATNNVAPYFASSQVAQLIVESEPLFNTNGGGWLANGGVANIDQDVLTLTDGGGSENSSIFFATPVYVGAFAASFTYTAAGSGTLADGITFCIQNSAAGTAAVGLGGGGLAYAGIPDSVALAFDLLNATPGGVQFVTDGTSPASGQYTPSTPVTLISGDPINVTLNYNGQTLGVTMTDTVVATDVFTTNIAVGPIPQYVGTNVALIGFTAATGSDTSVQTIANFTYLPLPLLAASASGTNIVITWPVAAGGYTLQQSSSLTGANWTTVSGPYSVVGANNQAALPIAGGSQFFRLLLQ